jgi:hypothetical protein
MAAGFDLTERLRVSEACADIGDKCLDSVPWERIILAAEKMTGVARAAMRVEAGRLTAPTPERCE